MNYRAWSLQDFFRWYRQNWGESAYRTYLRARTAKIYYSGNWGYQPFQGDC